MLLVLRAIGKGWYYNKKKGILEFSHQQYLEDSLLTTTEKTALVIAEISNAINSLSSFEMAKAKNKEAYRL